MIEFKKDPTAHELTWFGRLLGVFLAVLATGSWWASGTLTHWATALYAAAVIAPALFFLFPPIRRPLYRAWMTVAFPIGWTVSHLLMAIIYYGILTPVAVVKRVCGPDALKRRFDPQAASYWEPRQAPSDARRYFRQF